MAVPDQLGQVAGDLPRERVGRVVVEGHVHRHIIEPRSALRSKGRRRNEKLMATLAPSDTPFANSIIPSGPGAW
jgi:hypothetical protein